MLWVSDSCQSQTKFSKRGFLALGLVVLGFSGQASAFNSTLEALRSRLKFKEVEYADSIDSMASGSLTPEELEYMTELPGPVFANGIPVLGNIPVGANNLAWATPQYELYGVDFHTACLKVTEATPSKRYQIPESVVKLSKGKNPTMKLGMYGATVGSNPFSFTFSDLRDPTQFYLSSRE